MDHLLRGLEQRHPERAKQVAKQTLTNCKETERTEPALRLIAYCECAECRAARKELNVS